ncbi:CheR family methyltransferase [Burkholderia sp. 22PA0106]|uniref:CheR family methyltransferase n=1 Tax=Burkholderia sp. 22PA0106 TaxID=3237371 RepID=UPI0039C4771C
MTNELELRFHAWLLRETGIDPDSLGADFVARALAERIGVMLGGAQTDALLVAQRARNLSDADLDAYWSLLIGSAEEQRALIEQCVVPETWFFREREAFVTLAAQALERLRAEPLQPVRVLSAPCSTGEEPYSAAMALIDAGIEPARLRIDALDISARAIAHARRGEYGRNSFRGHALEFRARHFEPIADGWRLDERIRACVQFRRANLLEPGSLGDTRYDFIFCRNVLIYFDRSSQERAMRALDARLADDGLLFVGPAETGVVMRQAMSSARIPLAFAFRRARESEGLSLLSGGLVERPSPSAPAAGAARIGVAGKPVGDATALWRRAQPERSASQAGQSSQSSPSGQSGTAIGTAFASGASGVIGRPGLAPAGGASAGLGAAKRPTPAGASAAPRPAAPAAPAFAATASRAVTTPAADPLDAARALADAGNFAAAERAVLDVLRAVGPSADAYYLLGLIDDAQGRPSAAEHYRKALYLAPTHREALTHLATLLDIAGDHDGARWLKERARRADAQAAGHAQPGGRQHARRR